MQKKSEIEKRLTEAQSMLVVAEEVVHAVAGRERAAVATSPAEYALWQAEHEAAITEVKRLTKLIDLIEDDLEIATANDENASIRKRHAAQCKANDVLSKRIRADLARASDILLALMRDVASAAVEDAEINSKLPDDLDPVVGADDLARGKAAVPRKDIGSENLLLWVKSDSDYLIGDQDRVEDRGDGKGRLQTAMSWHPCEKRLFRSVSFHPAEPSERAEPLFKAIRLPFADRPGLAWNGDRFGGTRDCMAALSGPRAQSQDRPVETELIAVAPAPPHKAASRGFPETEDR